ncbi:MAG TPA: VCBS repeat-containing protein [Thermomicrobiales bacterium]|nr:VCBS repeat-containing protein [Thermomicrobiales bacterium]
MSATLTTLLNFNSGSADNFAPEGGLIANASGDLFGTTSAFSTDSEGNIITGGTVFEIAKTAAGYASTLATLVSFNGANGAIPFGSLIADAAGDLFGTTVNGGANNDGTVFGIKKTVAGYASTPTTLVSFNGTDGALPAGGLIADAAGDLFGTTSAGGANGDGTVFEIVKTPTGYASAPTTLVSFGGADGSAPESSLIADANGNLFGTASEGGANGDGTVFEIAKTASGYASTPTTLVSFDGADGETPFGSLIADTNGNLFGTTAFGGANGDGTVFEIKKTAGGYASTPTKLVSFDGADGETPFGSLIADAKGDLFGTTSAGGANGDGTVFEIKKTAAGYASAPTKLITFTGADGEQPFAGLIIDATGNLFGTTSAGGANGDGTVFEITGSGFVTAGSAAAQASDGILFQGTGGQAALWGMDGTNIVAGGTVSPNPGPAWKTIGTGDFNDDGLPDILWQSASGQAAIWDMDGLSLVGGGTVSPNPGPSWKAIATGDFNDDGHSDILWQSTSGQAAIWEMNGTAIVGGGTVSANPGPSWKLIGTGDFNDDGHSDLLWQNSSGQAAIWEMNGTAIVGGGTVSPNPGPSWKAIGTGDFNDDGHSDILWQNTSGQVAIWEMDGVNLIGGGTVSANPGPSWHAIGTGDVSGDGRSDILFQSTSGQTAVWDMNGTSIVGGGAIAANPGPSWRAVGLV